MKRKITAYSVFAILLLLRTAYAQEQPKKYPGDALGYLFGAQYYETQNNLEKAHALYDLAMAENPKLLDPRFFKALLYKREDRLEDTLKTLEAIKAMPEMEWITAELSELNIDAEIAKVKKEIQDKQNTLNPKPQKKKKLWDKLFSLDFGGEKKEKEEKPAGKTITKEQKTVPAVAHYVSDARVKIFKGDKDGLKAGDELVLVEGQHIVGKAKLIEVKSFYSVAELLDFEPLKTYAEGDVLSTQYFIVTAPVEQKEP